MAAPSQWHQQRRALADIRHIMSRGITSTEFSRATTLAWHGRSQWRTEPLQGDDALLDEVLAVHFLGRSNIGNLDCPIYCQLEMAMNGDISSRDQATQTALARYGNKAWKVFIKILFRGDKNTQGYILRYGFLEPESPACNPIYIPAEIGHPRGWFLPWLTKRPERRHSWLIAAFGKVQARMCSSCIRTYTSTVTGAKEHVMFPYFECIVLHGFQQNACANCVAEARGATCEYRRWPGYLSLPDDGGNGERALAGRNFESVPPGSKPDPVYLCPDRAPSLSTSLPNPDGNKKEEEAEVERVVEEHRLDF